MTDRKALELGCQAAGVSSRVPQLVVHQSALKLRQLLDAGIPPEDHRCTALIQLINLARLAILPDSNNAAKSSADLMAKAVHIDVSTATVAAIMRLKNASQLAGAAVAEVNKARPRNTPKPSDHNRLSLRLTPKLSYHALTALLRLILQDGELGERARRDAQYRSTAMAQKMNRLRAGQRHAMVRKRRLSLDEFGEATEDNRDDSLEVPASLPPPPPPPPLPPIATQSGPVVDISGAPVTRGTQPLVIPPMRQNIVLGPPVPMGTQIRPRPLSIKPQSRQLSFPIQQEERAATVQQSTTVEHVPNESQPFTRFRGRTSHPPDRRMQQALAKDKGVMNDQVGTPDEVMEAFLHPADREQDPVHETLDNGGKIRSVLAERERILYRLLKRRRAEVAAMPLGMTEQTRRNAIIEAKQLSLIELQRVVRFRVCAEMKKMYSLAIQEEGCVPADNLSRLFRRRDPPIYSYTDGYPRITPFDGLAEMKPRHPATIAQDSIRMAQFDMSRMAAKKLQTKRDFHGKLMIHFSNFKAMVAQARTNRARIWKGIERHLLEKKRAEERKRKLERIERLRLLRSNDEQAYFQMLKNTKNERLLQLVRQTDSYLMRIGAQVERERVITEGPSDTHNAFNEELTDDRVPIESMRRRRDLYYTVTHSVQEEVRQPSIMVNGTLKPYQIEGLRWMVSLYNNNLNGILADEMGLGKTIQTISLITYLVETKKNPGPFLIIVPLSTMGNWVRELDLWAPSLVKVVYRGNKATRRNLQQIEMASRDFNVLLTTYEFTVKDQHVLSRIAWKYIIIDEGHRMKNANCKLAMTLGVKYKSRNRLLLTGTPLQNNLTELWALLNFLLPTIFSSSDTFENWFNQPFESTTLGDTAELEEEERLLVINRLHQVLRPFLLRRLKTDVESQLPSKVEHVIHCDMSSWQRVIYRQVKDRIGLATGSHNGGVRAFNNLLMQCKKICNHPYLFYDSEAIDFLPQDYLIRASGKFFLLHHMLPKLQMGNHRTLIFSQMTAALDYLEYFLSAIGVQYLRLDGNTRADDRQDLLNRFNAKDSPYFCFLLSTRAGGLGLNLQTADTVIIFDSDWNPMMDLQAQDRAHRIGQTRVVKVYRLICSGTVEVKILDQANRKLQIDAQVIQAGQFNNKSTENDRHQMLKDLLRQKNDEEGLGDVPCMEELNRLFAQDDEEYERFAAYDKETMENGSFKPLFSREDELPEWVLQPDVDHKTAEEKEQEVLMSHGRGRRKRKTTHDMDLLTEAEWFKVVEGDMTVEEAFERRRLRKERRHNGRSKAEDVSTETEEESGEIEPSPSPDQTRGPSEDPEYAIGNGINAVENEAERYSSESENAQPEMPDDDSSSEKAPAPELELQESTGQDHVHTASAPQSRKKRNTSKRARKPKTRGTDDDEREANRNVVQLKVRVKRPLKASTVDEDLASLCNGTLSKRKRRRPGEDQALEEAESGTKTENQPKKQRQETLADNAVGLESDNQQNDTPKNQRAPRATRKRKRPSRSTDGHAREDVGTDMSAPQDAGLDEAQMENGLGSSDDADAAKRLGSASAAHKTPGESENPFDEGVSKSESKKYAQGTRKRRKVHVIPPKKPNSEVNEERKAVLSNGKIPHSSATEGVVGSVPLRLRIKEPSSDGKTTANGKSPRKRRRRRAR